MLCALKTQDEHTHLYTGFSYHMYLNGNMTELLFLPRREMNRHYLSIIIEN